MADAILAGHGASIEGSRLSQGTLTSPAVPHQCGIYRITNTVNGRVYIGSSKTIGRRFYLHRYELARGKHRSALLQRAWKKYGAEAFAFEVVLSCEEKDLLVYEQILIDFYDAANPQHGMNICSVAGRTDGVKWTESQRASFIADRVGRPLFKNNPVAYANLMASRLRGANHPFFGRKHTEAAKKSMSEKKKGLPAWNKGKPHPAVKGIPLSSEHKNKIAAVKRAAYLTSLGLTVEQAAIIAREALSASIKSLAKKYGLKPNNIANLKRQYQG